jgi:hypothetical protein
MAISIWFVRKDTGLPDSEMPVLQVNTADEVIKYVIDHKAGLHGSSHHMKVHAPAGVLSSEEDMRIREAGAQTSDEFLPDAPPLKP